MQLYGVEAYQMVAALTSSPWDLIDQLFGGAIRCIDERRLAQAYRIVEEGLLGNLNPSGTLSRGLADSYDIVLHHLRPGGSLPLARRMLVTMREGWKGIEEKKVEEFA